MLAEEYYRAGAAEQEALSEFILYDNVRDLPADAAL